MRRFYLAALKGSGTEDDGFRPAFEGMPLQGWGADDGRTDVMQQAGWMVCWVDASDDQHAAIDAVPGVITIPFKDTAGFYLTPDDLIGSVDPAQRTAIRTYLEDHHIPTDDLTLTDPIRKVIARVVRRIRIRRALQDLDFETGVLRSSLDFTEMLDTLISAIPQARRQAIVARLQGWGYATSGLTLTMTVRQGLQYLASQDVPFNRNFWD